MCLENHVNCLCLLECDESKSPEREREGGRERERGGDREKGRERGREGALQVNTELGNGYDIRKRPHFREADCYKCVAYLPLYQHYIAWQEVKRERLYIYQSASGVHS